MTDITSKKTKVVLVADRTLSGQYKMLFEGIFATMQTTQVPEFAMRTLVSPKLPISADGRASQAVLGLRRIEAALLAAGRLTADEIICTTPEGLKHVLCPSVDVVMVSSSDPLGCGMSNTTTDNFWNGTLYTRFWMDRMMEELKAAKQKYDFTIVGGGAGAWQWTHQPDERKRQGIDIVFEGYFEQQGPELIHNILDKKTVPDHIDEKDIALDKIKPICGPSLLGIIELSRGCGKGCTFCTMANQRMGHLPPETILSDLQTNVAAGITSVVSGSEDFFRYGGKGSKPNFEALRSLLEQMQSIKELSFMQIDHGNISTILQYSDEQLKEIRRLLSWRQRCEYLWVNMGIESANGHLVQANSAGKIAPYQADDWEDMVKETTDKMIRCGFFPIFSVVLGLPGETPEDVDKTLKLVKYLTTKRTVIFPIFYEPLLINSEQHNKRFRLENMNLNHLELYMTCYEQNFKWVPRMFWDNQRAGGVSLAKRTLIRMLGKTEIRAWRKAFRQNWRRIENRNQQNKTNSHKVA